MLKHFILLLTLLAPVVFAAERCVTDMSDRNVCLSISSPKIITLSPGSTELVFAAGAGVQVVAVDRHSNYPLSVKRLPTVGGFPTINIESIVAQQPDVVVIWKGGDSPKVISQLETLGIKTFHLNATTLDGIESALRKLGQLAGTVNSANKAADDFAHRLHTLQQQYSSKPPVTVLFELWRSPLMAVGKGLVINDVITLCGGLNVFADVATPTAQISIEAVLARNPQVIIGSDPRGDTPDTRQAMLNYWRAWLTLHAVNKRQLFSINSDVIARATPRVLDGAQQMCEQLDTFRRG